jgi:hypothetical protein
MTIPDVLFDDPFPAKSRPCWVLSQGLTLIAVAFDMCLRVFFGFSVFSLTRVGLGELGRFRVLSMELGYYGVFDWNCIGTEVHDIPIVIDASFQLYLFAFHLTYFTVFRTMP